EREQIVALHKAWLEAKAQTADRKAELERLKTQRYQLATEVESARDAFLGKSNGKSGPTRAELDLKIRGAEAVITDDLQEEAIAYGSLQAKTIDVAKSIAERAAQGYATHAARLAECHAEIQAVEQFVQG